MTVSTGLVASWWARKQCAYLWDAQRPHVAASTPDITANRQFQQPQSGLAPEQGPTLQDKVLMDPPKAGDPDQLLPQGRGCCRRWWRTRTQKTKWVKLEVGITTCVWPLVCLLSFKNNCDFHLLGEPGTRPSGYGVGQTGIVAAQGVGPRCLCRRSARLPSDLTAPLQAVGSNLLTSTCTPA